MKSRTLPRKPVPVAAAPMARVQPAPSVGPKNFLEEWNHFWFNPLDPIGLGLLRLVGGLLVLYVHVCYSFDLLSYVGGDQAWVDNKTMNWMRIEQPFYPPDPGWGQHEQPIQRYSRGTFAFSIFFHVNDPQATYILHGCCLGVMLLFTMGLWTRITSVLTFMAVVSYIQRNAVMLFGMDTMMVIFLFYMMIAPAGANLSVDRWFEKWQARRRGRPVPALEPSVSANFAMRGMQVHFCIIYMAAGLSKLQGGPWWNGTALWEIFSNYTFTPMNVPLYHDFLVLLCQHRWLWELVMEGGCAFTLFLELGLPVLIWMPRFRWFMFSGSVLLHTGIGLVMGLVTFSLFMLFLLASFIPPDAYRYLFEEVRKLVTLQSSEASAA